MLQLIGAVLSAATAQGDASRRTMSTMMRGGELTRAVYVSPSGSDSNNGSAHSPFATVHRAQAAIRGRPAGSGGTVYLFAGTYSLPTTLLLGEADSGCTYATLPEDAAAGRMAVLSGGLPITGWVGEGLSSSVGKGGKMMAPLPAALRNAEFQQLWVDGVRAVRARSPNIGEDKESRGYSTSVHRYLASNNTSVGPGFAYNASDIAFRSSWAGSNASVLAFGAWTASWYHIKSVDLATSTVHFVENKTQINTFNDGPGSKRFVVENLAELLDAPHEWYADFASGTVSYVSTERQRQLELYAIAPRLLTVVKVDGGHNITLRDLTISHSTVVQGASSYGSQPGLLVVDDASHVLVESCTLEHAGSNGIALMENIRDVRILRSIVRDTGADGVMMTSEQASDVVISDCNISDVGHIMLVQPAGVHLRGNRSIVLQHCEISHSPYSGVRVGWQTPGWVHDDAPAVFDVAFNRIHHSGLEILSDFGAVFLSSADNVCYDKSTPTKTHTGCSVRAAVRQNLIHDVRHAKFGYGANGVYMDEQVGGVRIERNTVYGFDSVGVFFHCGHNNSARNNVVHASATVDVDGGEGAGRRGLLNGCSGGGNPTYPNLPHGFTWAQNIGYMEGLDVIMPSGDMRNSSFSRNLYYSPSSPRRCCKWPCPAPALKQQSCAENWTQWRTSGQDEGTVVNVDPLFYSPLEEHNYTLRPGSPAAQIGWQPIDYEAIGPRLQGV
jgi:hypothetical protein